MKGFFLRFKNSKFFENTGWIIGERVFQMVVSLVVGMLSARYLGPTNYGVINYVAAFIGFGLPICGLGLEGVLIKSYVDEEDKAGAAIGTAILFEFIASIITSVVIVTVISLSNAEDTVKTTVAVLESFQLLFKSTTPIEFWYNSQLRSKYTSIIKMSAYSVMAIYRIVLLIAGKSVEWFAFATSIDVVVMGILFLVLYLKQDNPQLRIDILFGKELLGKSYHFILSSLMGVAYSQMDRIMIKHMLSDTDVGLYSAAFVISNIWLFLPMAIIASARPVILDAKNRDEGLYCKRLAQLYASIFWIGVAISLAVSVASGFIVTFLYGNDFAGASTALAISIWFGLFAELGAAREIWILAEKKNKYVKHFLFMGAVINFILNFILIRPLGINGAAIATLATQVFTCLIAPLLFKETRIHTKIVFEAISLTGVRTSN